MTENEAKTQTRLFVLIGILLTLLAALTFSTLFFLKPPTTSTSETITQVHREIVYDEYLTGIRINDILIKDRDFYFQALGFYSGLTRNNEMATIIVDAALTAEVPINLAFAIAWTESRFNPMATNTNLNDTTDNGIFQINDYYHPEVDPFDIVEASHYAMGYLVEQYNKFYSWEIAGMLYNTGTVDNIAEHSMRYLTEFMEKEKQFNEEFNNFRRSLNISKF